MTGIDIAARHEPRAARLLTILFRSFSWSIMHVRQRAQSTNSVVLDDKHRSDSKAGRSVFKGFQLDDSNFLGPRTLSK
jgi:hypothetical protein